jgi:hypothetical protein
LNGKDEDTDAHDCALFRAGTIGLTPTRVTIYWLTALALIAVAVGVQHGFLSSHHLTLTHKADRHRTGSTVAITSGGALSDAASLTGSNETSSLIADRHASSPTKLVIEASSQEKGEPASSHHGETSASAAVVGRVFPVSAAIEDDCNKRPDDLCNDMRENLAAMAEQPRDGAWATQMEALIEHDVLYEEEPSRFRIRNIECRTTLCAAEVETTPSITGRDGSYMGGIQLGHDALNAALQTNLNTFAYEVDQSGTRIQVTVITFTRR